MRKDNRKRIFSLLNMDELFQAAQDRGEALTLDRFDFSKPGYADELSEHLYSRNTDIDFVSRCECGYLVGNAYEDQTCQKCHTVVSKDMEAADGHLRHKVFIACPDALPGWMHPNIYRILSRWLTYGKFRNKINILDNIVDVTTPLLPELEGIVTGRGFTYLFNNFDYLMEYFLLHHKKMSDKAGTDPKTGLSKMQWFLRMNRDRVFCRYLPIMSSALHPIIMSDGANPNRQRYVDQNTKHILTAINALSYLRYSPRRKTMRLDVVEETAFIAYKEHIAYLEDISTKQLSKKKSLPRRHIFGARLHLTFRGVIVPIFGDHDYDELYLPWQIAIGLFRVHIEGRLMLAHNHTLAEAMDRQQTAMQMYDPQIHEMLNEFIAECPYKGLPCLFTRNPSLKLGSIQLLFITKIKPDVNDKSIEISTLVIKDPNADFDGDEMSGILLTEMDAVEEFMVLHPANRVLSTNETGFGSNMSLAKESFIVLNTFLDNV